MGRSHTRWLFPLLLGFGLAVLLAHPALAQNQGLVVRDGTLGSDAPGVVPPGLDDLGERADYLIRADLGAQRGGNLFHSFARFSIGSGERATFTGQGAPDPGAIDNVISRVTGGDPSEIRGTLRSTIPDADLWLLNPSGVVFGEGAQLDVPGSFHASTGDYLGFGEGGLDRFYSDPSRPSVLSAAPPAAFGFLSGSRAAPISVTRATLAVDAGETIGLAGGDVTLTSSTLDAPGGAVSIRGGRIVVVEGSKVLAENAGDDPAGTIAVAASESVLVDNSLLSVNTSSEGDAGSIDLESPEVVLGNGLGLAAATRGPDATGDAGTIEITADSVDISAGSAIRAGAVSSQGNAGVIRIDAGTGLRVDGGFVAALSIDALETGLTFPGAPGRIEISAGSVDLLNGAEVNSSCSDCTWTKSPDADPETAPATIDIVADRMLVDGFDADTGVFANSLHGTEAGTILIELTGSLELRRGGQLTASSFDGSGNAGTIRVQANSVLINEHGGAGTGIFAGPNPESTGDAGSITIVAADSVVISDQGMIAAGGQVGRGGTITVGARSLVIERQGILHAGSLGLGLAGTIDVTASESILIDGAGDPPFSLLFVTRRLQLGVHPRITGTFSAGGNGSIRLRAPVITLRDGAIVATTSVGGGDAGDVFLSGSRIHIQRGAFVDSTSIPDYDTGEPGGAVGSVTLEAGELIEVVGQRQPGHPSRVASASLGSGAAGKVTLAAPRIIVDGGAVATTALRFSTPFLGEREGIAGGDIIVEAGELIVRGGGRIDASSFIAGPGGNVDFTASESIVVEGEESGIASRAGAAGDGGSITLRAPVIEVNEGGEVSAKSEGDPELVDMRKIFASFIDDGRVGAPPDEATGNAGAVTLAADKLLLDGGTIATNAEAADGGDVTIRAKQLVHLDAGEITAAVRDGAGGNITIDPDVVILQNGSRIVANAGTGSGGNIQITADNYFAFPGSVVDASSELGIDGVVEVHAPDVDLAGKITALPTTFVDAASLMREPCAARRSGERAGSFAVRGNGGIPPEPDGWLPASVGLASTSNPGGPESGAPGASVPAAAIPSLPPAEGCR